MENEKSLEALIKTGEQIVGYKTTFDFGLSGRGTDLDAEEVHGIAQYIENPTKHGYWRLSAKWFKESELSKYIYENIKDELEKVDEETAVEWAFDFTSTLSGALQFFAEIVGDSKRIKNDQGWVGKISKEDSSLRFAKAAEIFKSGITCKGFKPIISPDADLFRIKSGVMVVLIGPRESPNIQLVSLSKSCLETMKAFYEATGQIENAEIDRVFSPEEILFEPYFPLLSGSFLHVLPSSRHSQKFMEAFNKYKENDYHHCVNALGLVAEEFLIEVYETFFREACPKGLTLGQLNAKLHNNIRELIAPDKQGFTDLDVVYSALKEEAFAEAENGALIRAIRELTAALKKDRAVLQSKIDHISKPTNQHSVFPESIYDAVVELTGLRNSAAHKTRVPISKFDALRALYCLMSLLIWWQREKKMFSWESDGLSVLRTAIDRAARK